MWREAVPEVIPSGVGDNILTVGDVDHSTLDDLSIKNNLIFTILTHLLITHLQIIQNTRNLSVSRKDLADKQFY